MYENHPSFETPESSVVVWRYMSFANFVWLLQNSSLWFARADQFEDGWEGEYPAANDAVFRAYIGPQLCESLNSPLAEIWRGVKRTVFINCWHGSPHESATMWGSYSKSGEAVAIRSTVGSLIRSIRNNPRKIFMGRIKYIDYQTDLVDPRNLFAPYLRKRKEFEGEAEVRMIASVIDSAKTGSGFRLDDYASIGDAPSGHRIQIDVSSLIEQIYLHPKCPAWFDEVVHKICAGFGFNNFQIRESELGKLPLS